VADESATKVSIHEFEFAPGLKRDEGWIDMKVQFLISAMNAGAEKIVFGRTVFAPGSRHEWHRHANAEEIQYLESGHGTVLDGDEEISVVAGDVVFTPRNRWHGFRNTSDADDAVVIWCWAGAASRDEAGYEARSDGH
jgi:quercetin dioxygenase-like cupin family protein